MRKLIFLFLVIPYTVVFPQPDGNLFDDELIPVISTLPEAWSTITIKDTIIFFRDELSECKVIPKIVLKVVPLWTIEKYANANIHNNRIKSQLIKLQEKCGISVFERNSNGDLNGNIFNPESDSEDYETCPYHEKQWELESRLIEIPQFHSDSYSYIIVSIVGQEKTEEKINSRKVASEIQEILNKISENLLLYR
ncbi:MAG: hypothetical protein OZ913_05395 [Ignavibacteriaceae bacterium]|jgi:hypothetical protein|nr:MAG: hypothetical protein EDM69_02260 [Chlorobiota bacterium]KXK02434.1 MAG: hypothetical protein UZ04_CHB001001727 [Chlorobi bacterium OLB4]MBV6398030.1 hypothetical protein [Ignavibacteria bacterium]MCC6886478.1 hypothetical protein [Ignavibacteriales bacterium]MCE7952446.1 hypothetical protein [Chlorobi bacterium CHB7]MDL1886563.1 hypothetical protein [Ignavibacteria bacterium CHB1]MEB2329719.1 hypothetical protein [Ignavibacteriaceae bacterium]OQY77337.1 MAG: hypothetical protein B6D4